MYSVCKKINLKKSKKKKRIGKTIPKGDNKWERGKLICINASKTMSELIRVLEALLSLYDSY